MLQKTTPIYHIMWSYMTGGLSSDVQMYRNVEPCYCKSGPSEVCLSSQWSFIARFTVPYFSKNPRCLKCMAIIMLKSDCTMCKIKNVIFWSICSIMFIFNLRVTQVAWHIVVWSTIKIMKTCRICIYIILLSPFIKIEYNAVGDTWRQQLLSYGNCICLI